MQRDRIVDITKGIAICLVIIGHQSDLPTTSHLIYSFHMPLFFLIAGYFFHVKGIRTQLKGDYKRLIKPYVFSCLLYLLWYVLFGLKYQSLDMPVRAIKCAIFGSGAFHGSAIWGNYPTIGMIWFLLALFWCRFVYNILLYKIPKHKYLIGGMISIIAIIIDNYIINLPWSILPGISAITFFMIGYFFRERQDFIMQYKCIIISVGILCWWLAVFFSGTSMVNCNYKCYPLDIIGGCAGTWALYQISSWINNIGGKTVSFLVWIGANSMTILCAHFLEQSTFVWEHVHIPEIWYIILPIKFIYVILFTLVAYYFTYSRNLLKITKLEL